MTTRIKKSGMMETADGDLFWETTDYNERPKCPVCGKVMAEGMKSPQKTRSGIGEFYWFCPQPSSMCSGAKGKRERVCGEMSLEGQESAYDQNTEFWSQYGIDECFHNTSLESFYKGGKLIRTCKAYLNDPSESLLFLGGCGSGKTHLAVSIFKEVIRSWFNAGISKKKGMFMNMTMLFMNFAALYSSDNGSHSAQERLKQILAYDFIVMDDMGAEKPTERSRELLHSIIDGRIRSMKPTIITTNLTHYEIGEMLGTRIASRLQEYKTINCNMPDYRKTRGQPH